MTSKESFQGHGTMLDYVFGPVQSSRLGLSLGVDLLGDNICSFDCLYCESGKTQVKTLQRSEYVALDTVIQELDAWFSGCSREPDHITLGGPGEPCLNSRMGDIIRAVKDGWPDIPLAVLTNSSLLTDVRVRNELLEADVVLPSLDSLVEDEFLRINRPHPEIRLKDIVQGMLEFKMGFKGKIYLEVLLLPGINDTQANFRLLRDFRNLLQPDRIDITVMSRPGAYVDRIRTDASSLALWQREFMAPLTGTKAEYRHKAGVKDSSLRQRITASIKIRPQTVEQLAAALGEEEKEVLSVLELLEKAQELEKMEDVATGQKFYLKKRAALHQSQGSLPG